MADPAAIWVELDELVPWSQNPRRNDEAVAEVAESIKRFGFAAPIIAREADRMVIAGHTRLKAAKSLGLDRVPVRFLDIDPADARLLALADNKLNERAEWDDEALKQILGELEAGGALLDGLGWDSSEIDALLADDLSGDTEGDDEAPPLEEGEPDSVPGQVYELGPHRLVCGDSTDPAVWSLLMGDKKAQMVWTDPPYGVAVNAVASIEEARRLHRRTDGKVVQNDDLSEPELDALLRASLGSALDHCAPGAAWYAAAPAGPLFYIFATVLRDLGVWRWTLQWVKDRFVLGRADYHHRHEPIFYGWAPGAAHYFIDDRTQDTVLEFPRPGTSAEHPTMKPVALVARCIANSSKRGWLVADPFGGSGTTLIAAAHAGRVARLIELDPRYCDVIRRRWTRWAKENGQDPGPGALDG